MAGLGYRALTRSFIKENQKVEAKLTQAVKSTCGKSGAELSEADQEGCESFIKNDPQCSVEVRAELKKLVRLSIPDVGQSVLSSQQARVEESLKNCFTSWQGQRQK